jgi:hypothetical protein
MVDFKDLNKTNLYPVEYLVEYANIEGAATNCHTFFVDSTHIKVFPSAWRGSELKVDSEGNLLPSEKRMPFNPESALHTEYNMTRTAGGVKSYIDKISIEQDPADGKYYCSFMFFLNGYAFEIYKVDLTRYLKEKQSETTFTCVEHPFTIVNGNQITFADLDLYAYIRVGDLAVGSNALDSTQVLMPFTWTSLDSPVSLDTTLDNIYLMERSTGISTWNDLVTKGMPCGGINPTELAKCKDTYVFTGLVLSTEPLTNLTDANDATHSQYYSIQLLKHGKIFCDNGWPHEVSSGQTENGTSTLIGESGLKADIPHMLAVGRFNETTVPDPDNILAEKTLFAVGNGTNYETRRNALEVLGNVTNTTHSHTVKLANSLEITHNNELLAAGKGAKLNNVYEINDKVEVSRDGTKLTVNKPDQAGRFKEESEAGIQAYNNVNILGDQAILNFVDLGSWNTRLQQFENSKIAAKLQLVHQAAIGTTPASCGLSIDGVHNINPKNETAALVFDRQNGNLTKINEGILIDQIDNFNHSICLGEAADDTEIVLSDTLKIKATKDSDGVIDGLTTLNKITLSNDDTRTNLANVKQITDLETLEFNDEASIALAKSALNIRADQIKLSPKTTISTSKLLIEHPTTEVSQLTVNGQLTAIGPTTLITRAGTDDKVTIKSPKGKTLIQIDPQNEETTIYGTTTLDTLNLTDGGTGLKKFIVDLIYPVGSIYMCMDAKNANDNTLTKLSDITDPAINILHPQVKFGGTWELTSQGRMLLGAGKRDSTTYSSGATGGNATYKIPMHRHDITQTTVEISESNKPNYEITNPSTKDIVIKAGSHSHSATLNDEGGSSAHKHNIPVSMPIPYDNAGYYIPNNFGTFTAYASSYYGKESIDGGSGYAEYIKHRPNWWERIYCTDKAGNIKDNVSETGEAADSNAYSNIVTETATHLIATLQMGGWLTPQNVPETFVWNTTVPVYT